MPFAFLRMVQPQIWGTEVFALGLWIALPLVAMLLFINLVLGLIGMLLTLPLMQSPFTMALQRRASHFQ